jgi:hypothetical protein
MPASGNTSRGHRTLLMTPESSTKLCPPRVSENEKKFHGISPM